jgi:hypothetical protein
MSLAPGASEGPVKPGGCGDDVAPTEKAPKPDIPKPDTSKAGI